MENLPGVPLWIFEIRSLKNLWNRPSQFYLPTVQFHEILVRNYFWISSTFCFRVPIFWILTFWILCVYFLIFTLYFSCFFPPPLYFAFPIQVNFFLGFAFWQYYSTYILCMVRNKDFFQPKVIISTSLCVQNNVVSLNENTFYKKELWPFFTLLLDISEPILFLRKD